MAQMRMTIDRQQDSQPPANERNKEYKKQGQITEFITILPTVAGGFCSPMFRCTPSSHAQHIKIRFADNQHEYPSYYNYAKGGNDC